MSRPFLFNSVVFVTILGLYCGNLRGVVRADDGLVRIPLQKSQDVTSKNDGVGPDMEINSSTFVPSNAFRDQVSIIEGQLNAGLNALNKNDVDKDKFADTKRENVPLDTKPVPLDAVQGQIGITQSQMNTALDAFQASTKEPGEKQAQNAVVQNTNETTPVKENVNTQDGAQVKQNGVQQSTNAEANKQGGKQPNTSQQEISTQNSQKYEVVDVKAFAESPDESDPEVTDYSSELSVEFTSSLYPFTQTIGAASGENDKTDMLDSMQDEDDFQIDDDDDVDSTKEQIKPKWFDEMMDDEDEEKKDKEDEENEDYVNYDDEDEKVTTASEEDSAEKSTLLNPYHFDSNIDLMGAAVGNGKFKVKENFVANRPIKAEQSMVSFYTWILLVIIIAVFTFLVFKNRHKVQGYILHFSRRRSNGSKLNGEEAKKLMTHEYA